MVYLCGSPGETPRVRNMIQTFLTGFSNLMLVDPCIIVQLPDNVHQLHVQQPSTCEKPEAASAGLGP